MSNPPLDPPAADSSSRLLSDLPLFPLQAVLFPGGYLPLRIFEVRYLDMIARRHKAGEPFGVVCLNEGSEVLRPANGPSGDGFAHEAFLPVGTLARIDELSRPQPGLLMIRCTGGERFQVRRSEKQKFGLWVADVELLQGDALATVPEDLVFTRTALQDVLRQLEEAAAGSVDAELPLKAPFHWDDCGWLANRWCELLPVDAAMKHRLMSLDSPVLRLELVADLLGRMGLGNAG